MKKGIEIAMVVTFFLFAICATIYGIYKERTTCDTQVTLTDGTIIEATRINSYSSGMSDIRRCDGSCIDVPTTRIKMVERLDSAE